MLSCPTGWQRKSISDVATIMQGGTPSTGIPEYWDGGITWVTPTDITRLRGMRISTSARTISQLGLGNCSAVLLPADTVLLCSRATIGELALSATRMATNQGFKNLICKADIDPVFLAYALSTKKDEMLRLAIGTTFLEISKSNLAQIVLLIPPYLEQRAIADVLAGFDEHLANLDDLITKKKAIQDGALEDLVTGRLRVGAYRDPWMNIDFEKMVQPKARIGWQGLKAEEYLSAGYSTLISGTDFDRGSINFKNVSFVTRTRHEMDPHIQVTSGDVLVTKDGTIGKVARVPKMNRPATLNSGVFVFRPKEGLSREFLYWVLMSPLFERFISALAAGSTIKHLYQKDLKELNFMAPSSLLEQAEVSKILFSLSEEIHSLEEERMKIERLKLGALDELLSGRIRLSIEEGAA